QRHREKTETRAAGAGPRHRHRPAARVARAQRHPEPRPDPGGRRRRRQTRPDDPRRRREDDRRTAQKGPQTDRRAPLRAREPAPPGAQETPLVESGITTGAPKRAPRKGERLEVEIDSLACGGRGVARADGFVLFVAGGLPGDRVLAEVTKGKKRFAEARTVELLRAGADRLPDRCVHGGEPCPGAPWQSLAYERQLAEKQAQVEDSLRRIGGLDDFEMERIVPALEEWRYRNKLEYSFGAGTPGSADEGV